MLITAHLIKKNDNPKTLSDLILNVTFVPSRITQQGVHRGEDFYSKDLFTFTRALPFTCPTEADMEVLEYKFVKGSLSEHENELRWLCNGFPSLAKARTKPQLVCIEPKELVK